MTSEINNVIKEYFRINKIKLKEVATHLNTSPSNLTERLNSSRAFTLDEFFTLYNAYGDGFAMAVMAHYNSRMLFLESIQELIGYYKELRELYSRVRGINDNVFGILNEIEKGILSFSK